MGRHRASGTVQQMTDGSWEARLQLAADPAKDLPARRVTRRTRTQEAAQEALRDLRTQATRPKLQETMRAANQTTVQEFLATWRTTLQAEVADARIREEHAADCHRRVRQYLTPGTRRISDLRPADLAAISARMHTQGLSNSTRRKVLLAIRKFLRSAAENGLAAEWVAESIRLPKQEHRKVRPAPNEATYATILRRLQTDTHPAAPLVLLAAGTGARRGEVCGARRTDVDLATGTWTVRTSLTWVNGQRCEHNPKNGEKRIVPLPAFVLEALKRETKLHPFRAWLSEYDTAPGEPVHADAVSAYYRKLATGLCAPTGLHSLRRYVITLLLDATDGDLDVVSAISGIKSLEVIRAHYVVSRDKRVTSAMSNAFSGIG